MTERQAKTLRYKLRFMDRKWPDRLTVMDWLSGYSEKDIRRQMRVIGEHTSGMSMDGALDYATNVTTKVKGNAKPKRGRDSVSKRHNVAFSLALTQFRGMADHKYLKKAVEAHLG